MQIHTNTSAIVARNMLNNNDGRLTVSMARLSSGYKINHSKDNPAGLAISRKMTIQIRGLNSASDSANDGISVVETAEGALAEVHEMLQRMNELAVKGANATMADEDREALQAEINQLQQEIARTAQQTDFNGSCLLDGSFDLKAYTNSTDVKIFSYSDEVMVGDYYIDSINAVFDADGNLTEDTTVTVGSVDMDDPANGNKTPREFPDTADLKVSVDGDIITLKGSDGFEMQIQIMNRTSANYTGIDVDVTGFGAMHVQIGANEGQRLGIRIPAVTLKTLGLDETDYTTIQGCKDAIDSVKGAISKISSIRSRLGAYQNRLEHTIASLDVTAENITAAYSRIMDTDMAAEMTEYTKNQVLTQAGTTILAQANQRPSTILQLLQ